jgi:hypothetical protein
MLQIAIITGKNNQNSGSNRIPANDEVFNRFNRKKAA